MNDNQQFCTFFLADHLVGIDIRAVQEIVPPRPTTPVARAPRAITGLINLRGQIITAVDLRRAMHLPERPAGHSPMIVVIRADDPVGFLVDAIGDIEAVTPGQFERPPDSLRGVPRQVLTGAYKLPSRLLLVLDEKKAIEIAVAGGASRPHPVA